MFSIAFAEDCFENNHVAIKRILGFVLVVALSLPGIAMPDTWTDYLSAQDGEVDWANTVRGLTRGKSGMGVLRKSTDETLDFQPLLQSLLAVTNTKDLILPVGGLGSGRQQELVNNYMRMIRYDNGQRWRHLIFEQTKAVAARFPERQVYWQIGNEINSWHFVETMSSWTESDEKVIHDPLEDIRQMHVEDQAERRKRQQERGPVERGRKKLKRNNSDVISLYVEYFLAPTAQAIINARKRQPEYESRVKIVLGTIANAHSERARNWLESLLNYRIRGDYSTELAGQKVSDIVDILALHYIVSSPGPDWRPAMRGLYDKWLGSGSIRGIWSTEEIGRQRATAGMGGASAISVWSRYTDLWLELGINPEQGRVNFWGWDMGDSGTRADDAMKTLMRLVGDTQLLPLHEREVSLRSTGDYEAYFFKTTQGKLVVVQFAADKGSRFWFHGFQTKWHGEKEPPVQVIVFGQSGQNELEAEVKLGNGLLTVNTPDLLSTRDVILVIVDCD